MKRYITRQLHNMVGDTLCDTRQWSDVTLAVAILLGTV